MTEPEIVFMGSRQKRQVQRVLLVLIAVLILAIISVFVFDTGSIADWIGRHRDTKIDEAIVVTVVLTVGLAIFSLRRWLDLAQQVIKFEALHRQMNKLTRESALLAELGDLLQSCLTPAEAHKLIVEHSQILFPNSSGAVCVTASSRDLVEAVAVWGDPALPERSFPPGDCWALRRGRLHQLGSESRQFLLALTWVRPSPNTPCAFP